MIIYQMSSGKPFFSADRAAVLLWAMLLPTMTGCIGYVDRPRNGGAYVSPPAAEAVVVVQDDYVYYPSYEVYYSNSRRQYAYRDGGAWVFRPAPRGVSVEVLFASPSVRMEFHDSPARHHAAIIRKYPRNWAPLGSNQGRKDNRRNDQKYER